MKKIIIILLLFFASQFVGAGLTLIFGQDPVTLGLCTGAAELLLIAVLCVFGLVSTKRPVSDSFRRKMPARWWLALIGFTFISLYVNVLISPLDLPDLGMEEKFAAMSESWLCILTLVVVAPLAEELVFRDGIMRLMMQSGTNKWVVIVCSAVVFGLVHGDLAQMIPAIILGVVLGWLYVSTGDLRLCLPAHILNNALGVLFMVAYPTLDDSLEQMGTARCIFWGVTGIVVGLEMLGSYQKRQAKQ